MKTTATFLAVFGVAIWSFAQGRLNFANSSSTLISANGLPMPISGEQQFIFALFLAPSTTVTTAGIVPDLADPSFQFVDAYTTNHASVPGRLSGRPGIYVGESQGYFPGSTIDFVVRGWSAHAGTTWAGALATWNNGVPLFPMYIGSSTVGNNLVLSGGLSPDTTVFGFGSSQVLGFDMIFVPEPSMLGIAGIGAAALLLFRRR